MAEIETRHGATGWVAQDFSSSIEPPWLSLVAEADSILAGFICIQHLHGEAQIATVTVRTEFRRSGIAGSLLKTATTELAKMGVEALYLEVSTANHGAIAFYNSHGFKAVGRRLRFYRDGTDALTLKRPLSY